MEAITIPYNYTPRRYQLPFLRSSRRFRVCVWHRRSGKSKTALNNQIQRLHLKPGIYYYILPTYKQAKQVIWDDLIKKHVPSELVDKVNDSELAIYWKNGSIQRFVGAEDPQKHRGINPIDVVFDEFSEMKEEMWTEIIQPVLRENGGTATFIYTFRGRNHAWKLYQTMKDNPRWFVETLPVDKTDAINSEELQEAERSMPHAFFRQEFYCDPQENASAVFRRIRENLWSGELEPRYHHSYQLGVDLAKYQDWTVITPIDKNTFKVGKQERFNNIDWNVQMAKIETFAYKFHQPQIVIDSTGVGDPICESLTNRGLNINPSNGFKFTETSRKQLLDNLALLLERDKIKIPDDETLISELEAFSYNLTDNGKIRMSAPEGMHDDCVMSLALAVWGLAEPMGEPKNENIGMYSGTFD